VQPQPSKRKSPELIDFKQKRGGEMGEGPAPGGARDHGRFWVSLFVLAASFALMSREPAHAQEASACTPAIARIVSLQGEIEVQRGGAGAWSSVRQLDTAICADDRLRARRLSRAALFVQPETLVRLDENTTISLRQSADETHIELHAEEPTAGVKESQCCGAVYLITRFPKKFKVTTPHLNAAVEGTEFMVESSRDASKLTVLEGSVSSESVTTKDRQLVNAGQSLATGAAGAGAITAVVRSEDAAQWVLRYPALSDASDQAPVSSEIMCHAGPPASQLKCLTGRAESLLRLGRVDEALADIEAALAVDPASGEANALRAVVQIAKNDKAAAIDSARKATESAPVDYRTWLALSYAQQAYFDLERSLESSRQALALQPDSGLLLARVAELLLSLGQLGDAEEVARRAVAADSDESHAHTILGFVHLSRIDIEAARKSYQMAIERDSFNPLPRLGLGLALIRKGDLVEGREQLEIAVALDPTQSLLRSYAGKAYYEENSRRRDELAATQFGLAKQLDGQDPTPYFYDAILRESLNRPSEALQQLQASVERNGNRAVYRSRLLLDDDAASRSAGVAAVYHNLGFEKLAIVESSKALVDNPNNFSAHRQLAYSYADLPRHDIARVSEALQSQIRQPVSLETVGPLLTTDNLVIDRHIGPARPGTNEYNALFNRNDVRVQIDGVVGGLDTLGDQFVASALADKLSLSLSQLHYETDGFGDNDAADKDIYGLLVHRQISDGSTIQIEAKRAEFSAGQTVFEFSDFAFPTTVLEESDALRLSGHHLIDVRHDVIWTIIAEDRKRASESFPDGTPFFTADANPIAAEAQYSVYLGGSQLVAGAGYSDETEHVLPEPSDVRNESANAYLYVHWNSAKLPLGVQLGVAAESFETTKTSEFGDDALDRSQWSPKLGLVWTPTESTTVRAAAFSSLHRPFIRSQTIEPTQVVGFNQFFGGFEQYYGDFIGTSSDRAGVALDHKFTSTAFGGAEFTWRELEVPSFVFERNFTWREKSAQAYFYKTYVPAVPPPNLPGWQAAFSAEIEFEEVDRPQALTGAEGIMNLKMVRAPIGIQLFSATGVTLRVATTYVAQDGRFSVDVDLPIVNKDDDGWITDLTLEYRLPERRGLVAIGAKNVFDNSVDLLEIDPVNPRVATEQFVFARFSLTFE
jgi:tetratricopeptide (TPR) repeat protein